MKIHLLLLLTFAIFTSTKAQINLVPNPSFEDTVYCPNATNQIDACANWLNFGNSPDYFNACDPTGLNVPNSVFGFQYAHTGNAMAGVLTYRAPNLPSGPNYREFIGVRLTNSLIIGQKYYFSLFTNFAWRPASAIASNNFGLNFTTVQYDAINKWPLINSARVKLDSVLIDSISWIQLSGSFIADSNYLFLGIGNFFDDINTDTLNLSQFPSEAYYYIDDICVSTDSLFNQNWTGLNDIKISNNKLIIFPNPASDILHFEANVKINKLNIYNILGELVFEKDLNYLNSYELDVTHFNNGLYISKINSNNQTFTNKLLINHLKN